MPIESKENIKRRMIKIASRSWGFSETQDINSFDPIVGMIFEAIANELHNISNEIKKTDARIVEKLLELLFSQNLIFSHFPSHGLVRLNPARTEVTTNDSFQFYYTKKVQKENSETPSTKDIYFSPSGSFKLFDGRIKYMSAGRSLYEIDNDNYKEPIAEALSEKVVDYSKIILGVELNKKINSPDGLSIYFHVKNLTQENAFYQMLYLSKCSINNIPVKLSKGLFNEENQDHYTLKDFFKRDNISYKANEHINNFYQNHFLTISTSKPLKEFTKKDGKPPLLTQLFPTEILKTIPPNLFWIQFDLPHLISDSLSADFTCSLNCIPVLNKELNEFTKYLHEGLNIIPLLTKDSFFDIRKITNSFGKEFHQSNMNEENGENEAYYIKHEGISRFDSFDAKNSIKHLARLIKDESAAFSSMGADMISSELKQIDQVITRLSSRVSKIDKQALVYAMLNSNIQNDRSYVQFWTTNGTVANNIRKGSKLNISRAEDIDSNSLIFITKTQGGREELTRGDKLRKMRSALLSHGRIVTKADIKALCFEHFGAELTSVEIKNGYLHDIDPKKGFTRSIDVVLSFQDRIELDEETKFMMNDLKVKLEKRSINLMPYRMIINGSNG